jgi:hypothetical protein
VARRTFIPPGKGEFLKTMHGSDVVLIVRRVLFGIRRRHGNRR